MPNTARKLEPQDEIRAVIDGWLQAVNQQDVNRIATHYAPDIVAFDAVMALQFVGREAYMAHWQQCLDMCPSNFSFIQDQIHIEANGDIAYSHCLNRCGFTDENGEEKASWMRGTATYRRINGQWLIAHEHFSAPFDCESGKAMFDLAP